MSILYKRTILTLAIVYISIIYGLPHLILSAKFQGQYTPFTLSPQSGIAADETYGYAGFANIVNRGYLLLKDRYVYEYSNYPTPLLADNIPSLILGFLARLSGSVEKAFIISDFIFPPIVFLLAFIFTSYYIRNFLFALATSLVVTFARDFITVIPFPTATFSFFKNNGNEFLYLFRTPHPQISLAFLLTSLICTYNLLNKKTGIFTTIFGGVSFGFLFYVYFFYFSYFWFFLALLFIYLLLSRKTESWQKLAKAMLIGLILGSYYFYNFFKFYQLEISKDFTEKMTLLDKTFPLTLGRYLIIAILFIFLVREVKSRAILFLFIFSSLLIIPLVQFLVGGDIETFHFVRFALIPVATITFFAIVYSLLKSKSKLTPLFSVVIILFFFIFSLKVQISQAKIVENYHRKDKELSAVFSWINQNTRESDVIGSLDQNFNQLASVYTKNFVYLPYASRTIMPTTEGAKRYILLSYLLGIPSEIQKQNLDRNNMISFLYRYKTYDGKVLNLNSRARKWTENEIDLLKDNWVSETNYSKLNFIVVTPKELNYIRPQSQLKLVTVINGYLLFRL